MVFRLGGSGTVAIAGLLRRIVSGPEKVEKGWLWV